jgi:hypothetical protein
VTSNSPDHNAKGTQSGALSSLLPLAGTRFQVLFHSPPGVLFTFPSRYWCTIGHGRVCSLGGWSPQIPTGFLVPRRTQVPKPLVSATFRVRDSHPLRWAVPGRFRYAPIIERDHAPLRPYNPGPEGPVWAPPVSLAATQGISFDFFSWGYLDVSVLPVGSSPPMDSVEGDETSLSPGFPIRASPDQRLRAAPRRFSQLIAPFFACPCQGIHRAPFFRLTGLTR